MTVVFYIAAAVALIATLMVVTRLNPVHALLYFIVSLFAVALVFYTLGAPFVAVLEVIVYAGAIMVLFLFVVMLLNLGPEGERQERGWLKPGIWVGPGLLALVLALELAFVVVRPGLAPAGLEVVDPKAVGQLLFTRYVLAVEIASMLLLAGLVGAYHIGRGREPEATPR